MCPKTMSRNRAETCIRIGERGHGENFATVTESEGKSALVLRVGRRRAIPVRRGWNGGSKEGTGGGDRQVPVRDPTTEAFSEPRKARESGVDVDWHAK